MLEAHDLSCQRGERLLFKHLAFSLSAGEWLHLKGKNGSGKSTLIRMVLGLLPLESGSITWREQSIHSLAEDYRREICYLGHANAIKEEFTPLENLLVNARLAGAELNERRALESLSAVGLASRADLPCKYLSQGQKRRVALARLVSDQHLLWILDEPFVALDVPAVAWLSDLIAAHLSQGGLAIITTHQAVPIAAPRREVNLSAAESTVES